MYVDVGCRAEMVNILVSSKKMDCADVAEIESQLVSERRVQQLRM